MSAPAAHISGYTSAGAGDVWTGTRRQFSRRPDILWDVYALLRKSPPLIASIWFWTHSEWHGADWWGHLASATFTIRHVFFVLMMVWAWSRFFHSGDADGRNLPRFRFIASQLSAVIKATAACTLLLWLGKLFPGPLGLRNASLTAFALRCGITGSAAVMLAAVAYSIAYRLSAPRPYLILGSGRRAIDAYRTLKTQGRCRIRVLGFLDSDESQAKYLPTDYLGSLDKLEAILMRNPVEMVYLTLPLKSHYMAVQEAIAICERVGVECSFPPEIFETRLARLSGGPLREMRDFVYHTVHEDYRIPLKRSIDVLIAGLLLVVLALPMLLIAIAIKLTSRGSVFFVQERYGRNRRRFRMYKFRSMVANAEVLMRQMEHHNEASGPIFKIKRDPRVTGIGRILRRSSLDELPQLINVLKGEMSLVGPRPMSLRDVHLFQESGLMRRFSVTPGVTGLWQVSGRSNTDFNTWIRLDLKYIDDWSLLLDLRILLRTVPAVLTGSGAV